MLICRRLSLTKRGSRDWPKTPQKSRSSSVRLRVKSNESPAAVPQPSTHSGPDFHGGISPSEAERYRSPTGDKAMVRSLAILALCTVVTGPATATGVIVRPMTAAGQQPGKAEKEKLKGDWILVSNQSRGIIAEIFGQVPEPDKIRIATFSDDQLKLKIDSDSRLVGTYHLDPTKAPKTLDLTIQIRLGKKATLQGIYELDGSHLKMCFDSFAEQRPSKFPPKAKDTDKERLERRAVLVLRRIGADPKQDALDQSKAKCARNLAQLAEVMYLHVSDKRSYPPAAIYSKDGKPLLSWRVALLKMMDEDLLKEFKTDEPWDSAHNKKLIKKMPKIYALPGVETDPGMTFFQVFTGKGTVFEGKEGLKLTDHLKGGGPSFMIVEAGEPVVWTKPDDLVYDAKKPLPKLGRLSDEGFHAALTFLGDRVQFIPRSTPEEKLRSMIQWRGLDEKENTKENKRKSRMRDSRTGDTAMVRSFADGVASLYEKAVLEKNPIAYWRLGEANGPEVSDRTGNGHKGICRGAVGFQETGAIQGDKDTAVKLDGKKSFIEIDNHKDFSVPTSGKGL